MVLEKAAIFHHGLNGCRVDNRKRTLLDFSFSFFVVFLRQKIVAAEQYENKKEVVSVEDDSREAEDVLSGVSVLVPPV